MEIIKNIALRGKLADRLDVEGLPMLSSLRVGNFNCADAPVSLHSDPLSPTFLYGNRIIAFDSTSPITHAYDVLRNHLIAGRKELDARVISVSAPTNGCGTTVTAVNLALSLARVPGANVLLVDANARDPGVGRVLGLAPEPSYEDPLHGWITRIDIRGVQLMFLRAAWGGGRQPLPDDLIRMTSQVIANRQSLKPTYVVFDLPPMLNSDEVIPFLDMSDTTVLVVAVGKSRLSELETARTYVNSDKLMQVVLNNTRRHGL
ncbi:hypothetical protein CYG48_17850 (plasmid) [Neorhizobium sp. SOG26]|uniref:hypothetical protein n=1 Tax=Neorhizobium sp. SOG26 TaxID=2060726 RepID=UPI000E580629|nr:hypothetical protein [Neorhizobium sp. SOG26]AXV17688.1 hypothetical protein CYG48_17850 [Neorhizobium sp. SOG26]